MTVQASAVTYQKPEPLISEQFEEAAKVARRDSLQELEAAKAGLEAKRRECDGPAIKAFALGFFFLLGLFLLPAMRNAIGREYAIFLTILCSLLALSSFLTGLFYSSKEAEKSRDLKTILIAIQLKTRKEEILALMP